MESTYKISFIVKGSMIGDDTRLSEYNVKRAILIKFNMKDGQSYFSNRDIDTKVSKLKIEEID